MEIVGRGSNRYGMYEDDDTVRRKCSAIPLCTKHGSRTGMKSGRRFLARRKKKEMNASQKDVKKD